MNDAPAKPTRQQKKKAAVRRSRFTEGLTDPLGATWDGLGVSFALFSAHATRVEVCLFDKEGKEKEEKV